MQPFKRPSSTTPTSPQTPTFQLANAPGAPSLAQGTGSNLTVTWIAPATDGTHGAATSYNLQYSPSGAGTWTNVAGVISPYVMTGLTAGASYDVEVQSVNAGVDQQNNGKR